MPQLESLGKNIVENVCIFALRIKINRVCNEQSTESDGLLHLGRTETDATDGCLVSSRGAF